MPAPTVKTAEEQIAEQIAKNMDDLSVSQKAVREEIERIKSQLSGMPDLKPFADIDVAKVAEQVEKLRAGFEAIEKRIKTGKGGMNIPGLEDEAERFSFVKAAIAMRTGNWDNASFEKRVFDEVKAKAAEHAVGVGSSAGLFVPDQVIPDIIRRVFAQSALVALDGNGQTRVSTINGLVGGEVKIPAFNGGIVAYWAGESDSYTESNVKVGDVTMHPKKLTTLARITNETRMLAAYGFEQLLRADMVRAMSQKLDYTLLYGDGSDNQPRGVCGAVDAAKLASSDENVKNRSVRVFRAETGAEYLGTTISDNDGAEMDFDDLDEMLGILEDGNIMPNESFAWIAHPRFFRRLKKLRQAFFASDLGSSSKVDQPYLLGSPRITDQALIDLIGAIGKTTQIPTTRKPGASLGFTTDSTNEKYSDVFAGNWSELVLGRWGGLEVVDDGGLGLGFLKDHIYIKTRMLCGTAFRYAPAIVVCPDAKVRD